MALFTKLLLYSFLMTFVACGAHAHDTQVGAGVVCDSRSQIEEFVALGGTLDHVNIVNVNAGKNVCIFATVRYIRGQSLGRTHADDAAMEVVEILVLQFVLGNEWVTISPAQLQYTIFYVEEAPA